MSSSLPETLVVLAHDSRIEQLRLWLDKAGDVLRRYRLLTTTELAEALADTGLEWTSVLSGKNGGEVQLAGLVPTQSVLAVIFLHEPGNTAMDFEVFQRVCDLNGLPLASNIGTALGMIPWLRDPEHAIAREDEDAAA